LRIDIIRPFTLVQHARPFASAYDRALRSLSRRAHRNLFCPSRGLNANPAHQEPSTESPRVSQILKEMTTVSESLTVCRFYHPPPPQKPSVRDTIFQLYDAIRQPVDAKTYVDTKGMVFEISENPSWTKPLGNEILIVDIDTRAPEGQNQIFNESIMDWESLESHGQGLLSAATMNHFLYCKFSYHVCATLASSYITRQHTNKCSANPRLRLPILQCAPHGRTP
jgi:hypothetical protein